MVDPEKLIASATRLWGDEMDRLWGEFRPVPQSALVVLKGGERITAGGRELAGGLHARARVTSRQLLQRRHRHRLRRRHRGNPASSRAGSSCRRRRRPTSISMLWRDSLRRISQWRPDTVFVTHFGPHAPVGAHLTEMAANLELTASLVKASLARSGDDEDREQWFTRGAAAGTAAADERGRRAGVRSGGPVRSELARSGEVLAKREDSRN